MCQSGSVASLSDERKWLKEFDGETLLPFPHGEKSDEWLDEMNGRDVGGGQETSTVMSVARPRATT
jgi:hypothetical protein